MKYQQVPRAGLAETPEVNIGGQAKPCLEGEFFLGIGFPFFYSKKGGGLRCSIDSEEEFFGYDSSSDDGEGRLFGLENEPVQEERDLVGLRRVASSNIGQPPKRFRETIALALACEPKSYAEALARPEPGI